MTLMSEADRLALEQMRLPPGKTCGDCQFLRRCKAFFGCDPSNTICDWHPSRFRQQEPADAPAAGSV